MDLKTLFRPGIRDTRPYSPGKPIEEVRRELGLSSVVKLASNENPEPPLPAVLEAIQKAAREGNRYPDASCYHLTQAMARHLDVSPASLIFGNGSNEVLDILIRALVSPGENVIYCRESFIVYPLTAGVHFECGRPIGMTADDRHDLPAMATAVDASTKLVIVCNPNNPTGTSVGANAFDAFMSELPDGVVAAVDEAYVDFARRPDFPDAMGWVRRRPGTIVLRTFSKIFGLAGLRIGYGVADAELAGYLQRARHPFNVSRLAEVAAAAALDDSDYAERITRLNAAGVGYLTRELGALGIQVWPTDANFVLALAGAGIYERLLRQGVIVRPLAAFGLPDHVRISVGLPEENERLVKTLRRLREGGA
jgi:histidinol-phosphate aminotransferase